jgi:broad specificity phosphatase PhoE
MATDADRTPLDDALPSVYLVRHGETAWSLSRQHTGRTDIPLTERGERDASALRARLQSMRFAAVLSSPLKRARHTAELAGFADRIVNDDDLLEWDYGAYEGLRTSEIRAKQPGWNPFTDGCPGGETVADVGVRADRVIARVRVLRGNSILFAHRDILRVLAARWIALPAVEGRRLYLETASVSVLGYDHDPGEPVIRGLNDA